MYVMIDGIKYNLNVKTFTGTGATAVAHGLDSTKILYATCTRIASGTTYTPSWYDGTNNFYAYCDSTNLNFITTGTFVGTDYTATIFYYSTYSDTPILGDMPVGTVLPYVGATAPNGFLLCDGKTVGSAASAADYKGDVYKPLYDLLNEASNRWENSGAKVWASNDVVKLPNAEDAMARFTAGNASSIFTDSTKRNAGLGIKQDDIVQDHGHIITDDAGQYIDRNDGYSGGSAGLAGQPGARAHEFQAKALMTTGGGTPRTGYETVPKNITFSAIIKYANAVKIAPLAPSCTTITNADYTFTDVDGYETAWFSTGNSNRVANLPTAADNVGRELKILKTDTGTGYVTIDGEGAETINGVASIVVELQFCGLHIKCTGSGWIIIGTIGECEIQTIDAAIELVYKKSVAFSWGVDTAHNISSGATKIIKLGIKVLYAPTGDQYFLYPTWTIRINDTNIISGGADFAGQSGILELKYYI
jgi:hypothetical protein